PFALFMDPGFLYSTLAIVCLMFVFTAMLFLIPLYLINIHHEKPYVTGLLLLPITGCIAFASPLIGHLADKISRNVLVLTGMGLYCLSTLMQVRFSPTTSLYVIIGSLVLLGLGWAVARNPATATAIASAPHHLAATAAGVLWTVQNGGGALSIAITGTMFRTIFETSSTPASFLAGYHVAMWFLSAVTFCIGLILLLGAYGRIKKNH
ncbi:MAG: MFS transporter, partial [Verrucomicrobia bacterium]|nr:MFS transporter [Verrucomicrobiota bacterium]